MTDARVISIGALAAHPLWNEREAVRTGHATTTLIRSGDVALLVDPGLPAPALAARLAERANLKPEQITHVFLTSFKPETTRAITLFENATWWISEPEREGVGVPLISQVQQAEQDEDPELAEALKRDVAILQRCQPAPDKPADRVDLFPLPGVTPGLTGLIIAGPRETTVICGDAIPSVEHLEQGKVLPNAADVEQAKNSLMDAVEIADLLILGRDNIVPNPTKRPFV